MLVTYYKRHILWVSDMLSERQAFVLASLYESPNETLEINYLMDLLGDEGYSVPNRIIKDAILEGIIYIDSITDARKIMVGLTKIGVKIWRKI